MIQYQEKQGMLHIQRKSSLILPLNGQGGDPVGEWKGEAFEKCLVGAGTRVRSSVLLERFCPDSPCHVSLVEGHIWLV